MANSRNVLITGASRGLGLHLVQRFHGLGWGVFCVVREESAAQILLATHLERCYPIVGDLRHDQVVAGIQAVLSKSTATLDVLINNAGVAGHSSQLETLHPNELHELFEVHCVGPIRCIQAALPYLKRAKGASIVNVSSRLGSIGKVVSGEFKHLGISYSMRISKAAQNMLTACLHQELQGLGISVYAVHPGRLQTRMGNPDADMTAEESAIRLVDWLLKADKHPGQFVEPYTEELPW